MTEIQGDHESRVTRSEMLRFEVANHSATSSAIEIPPIQPQLNRKPKFIPPLAFSDSFATVPIVNNSLVWEWGRPHRFLEQTFCMWRGWATKRPQVSQTCTHDLLLTLPYTINSLHYSLKLFFQKNGIILMPCDTLHSYLQIRNVYAFDINIS